jgi:hypothetical protein
MIYLNSTLKDENKNILVDVPIEDFSLNED